VPRHREDVPTSIPDPPLVVELVLQTGKPARSPPLVVLLLVRRVPDPGREGHSRPIRRPDGLGHVLIEVGQPPSLATGGWNHVQLLRLALPVRDEGEPAPVERPARRQVLLLR